LGFEAADRMTDTNPDPDDTAVDNDPDHDDGVDEGRYTPRRLWQAFNTWIDTYAWTIITLGVALILLDVLIVLTFVLFQVFR
jgi:hypothetical protein